MTAAESSPKETKKSLILKALTDLKFRKLLTTSPEKALNVRRLTEANKTEVRMILASVKAIEGHIAILGDSLLCAGGGGGCGIAIT